MASGRPLNYTTTIPVTQTMAECQSILAAAGAASVAVHFEDGSPAGLSFSLRTPHGMRNFTLPVDVAAMQAVLVQAERAGEFAALKKSSAKWVSREHAANVAWRVVKDWLEANLALIAAQMATLDEVMLPFLHVGESRTLYQAYREREETAALLPGGTGNE